jgi:hypothetical protein
MASRMFVSIHPTLPFFISRMEKKHKKGGITTELFPFQAPEGANFPVPVNLS